MRRLPQTAFGIPIENVRITVQQGDTDIVPTGRRHRRFAFDARSVAARSNSQRHQDDRSGQSRSPPSCSRPRPWTWNSTLALMGAVFRIAGTDRTVGLSGRDRRVVRFRETASEERGRRAFIHRNLTRHPARHFRMAVAVSARGRGRSGATGARSSSCATPFRMISASRVNPLTDGRPDRRRRGAGPWPSAVRRGGSMTATVNC